MSDTRKTQAVRFLDVFAIGPVMMAGGVALTRKKETRGLGGGLFLTGLATMAYNLQNLERERESGKR